MISAKILADSINTSGNRLTTFEIVIPKMIQSELNTHRIASRNSQSSRAVPFNKLSIQISENPFIPVEWGLNKSGMQADEILTPEQAQEAEKIWLEARDANLGFAQRLDRLNVHKQIKNRLLENWIYTTVIISATQWNNFFGLRAHEAAQPEFRACAYLMKDLYKASEPRKLLDYEWHLPLVDISELPSKYSTIDPLENTLEWMKLACVSGARCTRVSYVRHLEKKTQEEEQEFVNRLASVGHMSGLEHCAMAMPNSEWIGNFKGFKQLRKFYANESGEHYEI